VFTPEPAPLPPAGPAGAAMLSELLKRRRIDLHVSHKVSALNSGRRISFENGASYDCDMLIVIPPHRPPQILRAAGLTDESGWVKVDPKSLRTQVPDVFAIGDVTSIRLPSGGALPKAGVFAAGEAETVAHNIASDLRTHAPLKDFGGTGHCYLETGYGRAGFIQGDFYAKPAPVVSVDEPSVTHHWKKVVFEKYWLWRWF
jgi:sulfide:quinone oxidoreductase